VEVDQEAEWQAEQPEVGRELDPVDRLEGLDGLELDQQLSVDQQVDPVGAGDGVVAITDGEQLLAFHRVPARRELQLQAVAVGALEQAGPERPMHGQGGVDRGAGERLDLTGNNDLQHNLGEP